jgi:hypothetical protein
VATTSRFKATKGLWRMPMAPKRDEGRDKLRKASGSGTYTLIRRCPNVGTHQFTGIQ